MSLLIVTVVKNDITGLRRTASSLQGQSQSVDWHVVTPEDFSETHQLALNLRREGLVTQLTPDEGKGIYPAMNIAIANSRKDQWIWFLNSGDELAASDSVELVQGLIVHTKHRWLYGGHKLGSSSGLILGENPPPLMFNSENQLFSKRYVSHQSTIFKNEFLRELGGFRETFQIAADWDLLVRASKTDTGFRIPKVISVFYMGGLSTSQRSTSNAELLVLRKEHLARKYVFKSYFWFFYRHFRNSAVQALEKKLPKHVDKLRSLRFLLRQIVFGKKK